eukprot:CAMPEP_0114510668 /NCGR_PEP_ID=MMETSP0109-20121206/13932_1 /TAXON_ID=29199 /ORGANISM="Chlorarachnion reptans, Strain CCCM449" /LENGTH=139 /DNA_ID=CAMNT_0001690035 /DNA_START=582 /DNA_END=1001 /DNA_ORIENTATION=-
MLRTVGHPYGVLVKVQAVLLARLHAADGTVVEEGPPLIRSTRAPPDLDLPPIQHRRRAPSLDVQAPGRPRRTHMRHYLHEAQVPLPQVRVPGAQAGGRRGEIPPPVHGPLRAAQARYDVRRQAQAPDPEPVPDSDEAQE